MHFRKSLWLAPVILAVGAVACSSASDDEASSAEVKADDKLRGQTIAIAPFDSTNPACFADPTTMDRDTFAACVRMNLEKLPSDYHVVTDVALFEPAKRNASIFVIGAIDGNPAPWYALIGVGPAASVTSLTTPKNNALVMAAPASVVASEALAAAGLVVASEVVVPAVVIGGAAYLLYTHAADIRDGASALIDKAQQLIRRNPCTGGYFCRDSRSASQGGCDNVISGAPCTYRDESGTTYGSGSGFCGGTRSFSSDGQGKCFAPCTCRESRVRR